MISSVLNYFCCLSNSILFFNFF
uniref:Uncharacterized protein n=1 Tax=Arundo donax TaxID=35708 RepID=A0A0A8Y6H9_ARUDO